MDGLNNIIEKIKLQNESECLSVIESAEKKAKEIKENAKAELEIVCNKIKADTDEKISVIMSKAKSTADLEYKRVLLLEKGRIVSDIMKEAYNSLCNAESEVYFSNLEKLVLKNAIMGKGKIVLSEKDNKRLPADFLDGINKKLGEGKELVLSEAFLNTDGGFVLEYSEIKVDCTFSSLIDENADDIKDEISKLLFA